MRTVLLSSALLFSLSATAGSLMVSDTSVRASLPGQNNTAAFATWHNHSDQAITLTSLSSPAAKKVELHTHVQQNGQMQMREAPDFSLKPGESVNLKKANLHLMLIDMPKALKEGDSIQITACFNNTDCTETRFTAVSIHNEQSAHEHEHHH